MRERFCSELVSRSNAAHKQDFLRVQFLLLLTLSTFFSILEGCGVFPFLLIASICLFSWASFLCWRCSVLLSVASDMFFCPTATRLPSLFVWQNSFANLRVTLCFCWSIKNVLVEMHTHIPFKNVYSEYDMHNMMKLYEDITIETLSTCWSMLRKFLFCNHHRKRWYILRVWWWRFTSFVFDTQLFLSDIG